MSTPFAESPQSQSVPQGIWPAGGLAVLNVGGSDALQSFEESADGAGTPESPGSRVHAPVNYHAYAACTRGSFHRKLATVPAGQKSVLLLLRRDLKLALKTLELLKASGRRVAISIKESGYHQVATLLSDARRLTQFREICAKADLALSSTQELAPFYRSAGATEVVFLPTPYPVDSEAWDFSRPVAQRRGVFIGTREFGVTSRNHLGAVMAARQFVPAGEPLTVINQEGRSTRRRLEALGIESLRIVEGRLDYPAYLRLMAQHRLVFQLDRSAVPGQVAGDALLCRLPCVGGDGAVDRVAFPHLCGFGRDTEALQSMAQQLLENEAAYSDAVAKSQEIAGAELSFRTGAERLKAVF